MQCKRENSFRQQQRGEAIGTFRTLDLPCGFFLFKTLGMWEVYSAQIVMVKHEGLFQLGGKRSSEEPLETANKRAEEPREATAHPHEPSWGKGSCAGARNAASGSRGKDRSAQNATDWARRRERLQGTQEICPCSRQERRC